MNRIRQHGKTYQVLVTPSQKYDPGMEFLIGSWTDENMSVITVKEFGSYSEAECEAVQHPDINWIQLVEYHKDFFHHAKSIVTDIIKKSGLCVTLKPVLLTPEQAKNKMFDRVIKGQRYLAEEKSLSGFRTIFDMNDIVSFSISNPWTKNLEELSSHLLSCDRLNVFKIIEKNGVKHLVGRTDIGTTYEIVLVPSILQNWIEWRSANTHLGPNIQIGALKQCIKSQSIVDNTPNLR